MAPRLPRPKPRRTRGRPKIDWDPWLEKMHNHVLEGETDRRASELVAQDYRHEIPQGSTHGQRTDQSTARQLRKYYPGWLERKTEIETLITYVGEMQRSWEETLDRPEIRRAVEVMQGVAHAIETSIPLVQAKFGKTLFDASQRTRGLSSSSFATAIKSQKRVK